MARAWPQGLLSGSIASTTVIDSLQEVPVKSRKEIAKELVEYHVLVEDGIIHAFRYERAGGDLPDEPLKLLEVNRATVPAGIAPVYFGASRELPVPVVIIEVTEEEFEELELGDLALPDGWDLRDEIHGRAA